MVYESSEPLTPLRNPQEDFLGKNDFQIMKAIWSGARTAEEVYDSVHFRPTRTEEYPIDDLKLDLKSLSERGFIGDSAQQPGDYLPLVGYQAYRNHLIKMRDELEEVVKEPTIARKSIQPEIEQLKTEDLIVMKALWEGATTIKELAEATNIPEAKLSDRINWLSIFKDAKYEGESPEAGTIEPCFSAREYKDFLSERIVELQKKPSEFAEEGHEVKRATWQKLVAHQSGGKNTQKS